jgi:hypothetical protein
MVTPNAIAEGSATSIAARPPQKSPARFSSLGSFIFFPANAHGTKRHPLSALDGSLPPFRIAALPTCDKAPGLRKAIQALRRKIAVLTREAGVL